MNLEVLEVIDNERNGFSVVTTPGLPSGRRLLHYRVDPEKNPETELGRAWLAEVRRGMDSAKWNREYEGDPYSHVGKAVHPDFRLTIHVQPIEPIPAQRMYIGIDPGIRLAAAAWLQIIDDKETTPQVRIYRELKNVESDMGVMGKRIREINQEHYPAFANSIHYEMDIAANQRSQATGDTVRKILGRFGIATGSGEKSKPDDRIKLINHLLCSSHKGSQPAFLIHPSCHWAIAGLLGLYRRKENSTRIDDTEAVHIMDAIQYPVYNCLHLRFERMMKVQERRIPGALRNLRQLVTKEQPGQSPDWMEV